MFRDSIVTATSKENPEVGDMTPGVSCEEQAALSGAVSLTFGRILAHKLVVQEHSPLCCMGL